MIIYQISDLIIPIKALMKAELNVVNNEPETSINNNNNNQNNLLEYRPCYHFISSYYSH